MLSRVVPVAELSWIPLSSPAPEKVLLRTTVPLAIDNLRRANCPPEAVESRRVLSLAEYRK